MKKLLVSVVLLFGLSAFAAVEQKQCEPVKDTVVQSGCCSWHGGVCGCSGGRALCCDGTPSPSCGCLKDDIKEPTINNQTPETVPQA